MLEHLKSGLSISTHVGCQMGCHYCVLSIMGTFSKGPIMDDAPESIIDKLSTGESLFVNGETPLVINNRTDPLLPSVREHTYRLLELCELKKIISPIVIISKFAPKEDLTPFFDTLKLMYIYSYSGYKKDFNYNKVDDDIQCICQNVPSYARFHYLRPIIPGINDNEEDMRIILDKFSKAGFAGSILAGFRVNKDNRDMLISNQEYSTQHKLFPTDKYSVVYNKLGKYYNLFRHTSCGISFFTKTCNKLNYQNKPGHCFPICVNYKICTSKQELSELEVHSFMISYLPYITHWKYGNGTLFIDDEISQEVVAFIKNAIGVRVKADNLTLSVSEQLITQ